MNHTKTLHLILLRHGVTDYNLLGKMQGHVDTPLSHEGQLQAKKVAQHLVQTNPWKIYSSDLKRAVETAIPLAEATACNVHIDKRLRETHLGEWSGLSHQDVDTFWPGSRALWSENPHYCPPSGETKIAVAKRGIDFIHELIALNSQWAYSQRPIVIVSHNGFISALTAALIKLHPEQWSILHGLANTGWAVLKKIDTLPWKLQAWNRTVENNFDELHNRKSFYDSSIHGTIQ